MAAPRRATRIPFRTGNLGVPRIQAACRGLPLPPASAEYGDLEAWRRQGFQQVEDYVGWAVVEPERGAWDFESHRRTAAAARAAGLEYVVYAWPHALPPWFREAPEFRPALPLHGTGPGRALSLFAAETETVVHRFYVALQEQLGDELDGLVIGFPADYGEIGFESGLADWVLGPAAEGVASPQLWCGENGEVAALARRLEDEREREPFARVYRGAVTRFATGLIELCRRRFGDLPLEIKLGHASESLLLGADYHALVSAAAASNVTVRSTHSCAPELFVKRVASLCSTAGAEFATEASRLIERDPLKLRVFEDLAHGTASWFEFPEQHDVVERAIEACEPALGRARPRCPIAIHYPVLDLDMNPGQGVSEVLAHVHDELRASFDFDLLEERQLVGGALDEVGALVWLDANWVRAETLDALASWVRGGGVLVSGAARSPRVLGELGDGAALAELLAPVEEPLAYELRGEPYDCGVEPGSDRARLFLGRGWRARENGAFAWTDEEALVPSRWAADRAEVSLPVASETLFLSVHSDAEVELSVVVDGELRHSGPVAGPTDLRVDLGERSVPVARIELVTRPTEGRGPGESALLVRAIGSSGEVGPGLRMGSGPEVRLGRGRILRGDGTPLSALCWVRTWLGGGVEGAVPPDPVRDAAARCRVSRLDGGVLVFNPDSDRSNRPELIGSGAPEGGGALAPLETRWLPKASGDG